MNNINQDITRMIVEMRELGKLPAPCKGGSHNNLLRYNKLRDRILDKFLSAFDEGYRLEMPVIHHPNNEPLTLKELREMNEEPVWVQNLEEPAKSQWRLLYWDRGKYLVLQGISVRGYLLEEYGESWLAYRRPPEGEEDT